MPSKHSVTGLNPVQRATFILPGSLLRAFLYICAGSGAVLLQPKGISAYEVYIVKFDTVPVTGFFFGILFPGVYYRLFDSTKLSLFIE
ncbi:hypothetical protein EC2021H102_43380 [Escherichia coli]